MPDLTEIEKWESTYNASFLVELDGVELGRFKEISGLQVDVDVESVEEGGENGFVHKFSGRMTWPNLVLKRGITKEDVLMKWLNDAVGDGMATRNGKAKRTTAAITLLASDGTRLRSWNVSDAMPIRWAGPTFSADAQDAAVEEVEIAHHGFKST
ncbi:MAG: phage tail protein [Ilumatobacteraceae bacterium]